MLMSDICISYLLFLLMYWPLNYDPFSESITKGLRSGAVKNVNGPK